MWRIESSKVISVTRLVRDVGLAEDLAQDALVAALEQWMTEDVPRNPSAWLTMAANRRGIDTLRRRARFDRKQAELAYELEAERTSNAASVVEPSTEDDCGDGLLRLMFVSCHPVLPADSRVALTLRLLEVSRRSRWRERSWFPSPPFRSVSFAPNGGSHRLRCRSRCLTGLRGQNDCRPVGV